MATHEKILKRVDGSKVKITAHFGEDAKYSVTVETCKKGRRIWQDCLDQYAWVFRKMSLSERAEITKKAKFATAEEILEAKMELWQKLKPELEE